MLLVREVGEEEVKRAGQRSKHGDSTSLPTPQLLQDLERERLSVAIVHLRDEREGKEEEKKMAFPPTERFAVTALLLLLHLATRNYLIKVFLCFFLYLLLCINRYL